MRAFFNFVAGQATAYRPAHRGQHATVAAAETIADHTAKQGAGDCANAARFGLMLNRVHCFNRSA